MHKIRDYDRKRTKRLLYFVPVSIIMILIAMLTAEKTRVVDRMFTVGYEGPMKLLPEITIIDDKSVEAEVFSVERHDMKVREVEIFNEEDEEERKEDPDIPVSESVEKELEEPFFDDIPGNSYLRTYPSHTDVPYREDYVILKMVQPVYPEEAINKGLEGYVLVEVFINDHGKVEEAWVRKVAGVKSFESASLEAVKQFEFKPIRENGEAQSFWISFLISFKLKN